MLHNPISVDMKVCGLQLNEKSTAGVSSEFYEILEQLLPRTIFGGCFLKENKGGEGRTVTLVVSGFHFYQGSYLLSHEARFFTHNILIWISIWIMLSIFIYLTKSLVVQFLPLRV